jgi:hypothetical protein
MSEVLSRPDDNSEETFKEMVSEITPSWEKEDAIPVPPQCESCPRVMAALLELDEYKKAVGELLRMTSAGEEKVVVVNRLTGERLSEGAIDRVCEITGKKLNELDKIKEEIVRLTNECEGPFVLVGYDDSRVVSVTTCGSSEMFKSGLDSQYELVRVQRYQEENKD